MKTYWFVYFEVYFVNRKGEFSEIKGNSVHELASESFLPGMAKRIIRESYLDSLKSKILDNSKVEVVIKSFGEIGQKGFDNFSDEEKIVDQKVSIQGRDFVHTTRTIITEVRTP